MTSGIEISSLSNQDLSALEQEILAEEFRLCDEQLYRDCS